MRLDKGEYTIVTFTEYNPINDNIDVEVQFRTGERYGATFFTLDNIRLKMAEDAETGEYNHGQYFWCTDMVIVRDLHVQTIEEVVAHLIKTGDFKSVFEQYFDSD